MAYYQLNPEWLAHHGIKGQKWGVRRFQNPDGTLTEAGKKRYGYIEGFQDKNGKLTKTGEKLIARKRAEQKKIYDTYYNVRNFSKYDSEMDKLNDKDRKEIGEELYDKSTEKMFSVLSNIYRGDYKTYAGKHATNLKDAEQKVSSAKKKWDDFYDKEYSRLDSETPRKTGLKAFLAGGRKEAEWDRKKSISDKIRDSKEYKSLFQDYKKAVSDRDAIKLIAGEDWKNTTLSSIINSAPREKAAYLFAELKENWWHYD